MSGGGGVRCHTLFDQVMSLENLVLAWERFRRGKSRKRDVATFGARLEDALFALHEELRNGTYRHGQYRRLIIHDPKRREISCATVRDRVVHQALVQAIEPLFERRFIHDSYASRAGKGTHAMAARAERFLRQATANFHRTAWVLQCDIRKCFDSIRHDVLLTVLAGALRDARTMRLVEEIVRSFARDAECTRGLPLGNVTSQLFANAYLDGLDHVVKERFRMRWYLRFCDDFLIIHPDRTLLQRTLPGIRAYLRDERGLDLHPEKVTMRKFSYGIDVVGTVLRPHYHVLRTRTRRRASYRMVRSIVAYHRGAMTDERLRAILQSTVGLFAHGSNARTLEKLREVAWRRLCPVHDNTAVQEI